MTDKYGAGCQNGLHPELRATPEKGLEKGRGLEVVQEIGGLDENSFMLLE